MVILGIETSCDETAASVVENGTKLISNILASSQQMHQRYGGIVPDRAAREQLKCIIPVIQEATKDLPLEKIDGLAVTSGPGLIGSLLVGVETAKALSFALNKPVVPVNHLIGHIYANWIDNPSPPPLPALVLLVSGGHSEIILMKDHGKYKLLGSTRDDAAGECFDKCGRLLNLPYPYGPYIETLAEKYDPQKNKAKITFPRPMIISQNLDLSFSGLKTAFLYEFRKREESITEDFKIALAFELQSAIVDVLVKKFLLAANKFPVKSFILAGGVAANKKLREKMQKKFPNLFVPPINLCTDNAAYIASAAYFNYQPLPVQKVQADPGLSTGKIGPSS